MSIEFFYALEIQYDRHLHLFLDIALALKHFLKILILIVTRCIVVELLNYYTYCYTYLV